MPTITKSGNGKYGFHKRLFFTARKTIVAALAGVGTEALGARTSALNGLWHPRITRQEVRSRMKNGGILLSFISANADWTKRATDFLEHNAWLAR
jgi:hypothetical protein